MLPIDTSGYFPIQLAANKVHEPVVKLFLEKGFHPNTVSWATSDPSALHSAVLGGYSSIVKLLLDHGANASLKGKASNHEPSPLDLALSAHDSWVAWSLQAVPGKEYVPSGQEDCVLLLIQHTPAFEIFEDNKYLVHATRKNFVKVVKALLDLGIDSNMRLGGQNALSIAKSYRYQELIDILEPLTRPAAKKKGKNQETES
jgi:ankyrin repeat protein